MCKGDGSYKVKRVSCRPVRRAARLSHVHSIHLGPVGDPTQRNRNYRRTRPLRDPVQPQASSHRGGRPILRGCLRDVGPHSAIPTSRWVAPRFTMGPILVADARKPPGRDLGCRTAGKASQSSDFSFSHWSDRDPDVASPPSQTTSRCDQPVRAVA
jgi:hypothetical protein